MRQFLLAVLLLGAPLAAAPVWRTIYVSPAGDDAADGSRAAPVKTLERARDLVRAVNRSAQGDIVVSLAAGTYPIAEPIVFGPEDSGFKGWSVRYVAPAGRARLSGGVALTGWVKDGADVWKAPLRRESKLRWLYDGGVRIPMAASAAPVRGLGPVGKFVVAGNEPWAETPGTQFDGIRFPASAIPGHPEGGDLELAQRHIFNAVIVCARSIEQDGDSVVVRLQQPYGAIAASLPWGCGLNPNGEFTIANARGFLAPGEFFYDRAAGWVYYRTRSGAMPGPEVVAPVSAGLLRIEGRSTAERVRRLEFRGLTLSYDDWQLKELAGSRGFVGVQSLGLYVRYRADGNHHRDHYACLDLPQATVDLRNCEDIRFDDDRFEHLDSGCAISLTNDVVDSQVDGNRFIDLSGNAVNVGHPQHYAIGSPLFPAGIAGVCDHDVVANNVVRRVSREFLQEEGISGFFTRGLTIAHNDIREVPYGGISLGWWWGNAGIPASTVPRDNVIADNRVEDALQVLRDDGGDIYVLGVQPGSRIEGNYVVGGKRQLYLDDGAADWTVTRNVAERGQMWLHIWTDRTHDLTIAGNYTDTDKPLNKGVRTAAVDTHDEPSAPPWSAGAQAIIAQTGPVPPSGIGEAALRRHVARFNAMENEPAPTLVPNADAAEWLDRNIPLFECPDPQVEEMYYFRWWALRKHLEQAPGGGGLVFTEFINRPKPVSSALGHHAMEGRWWRDRRWEDEDLLYWLRGGPGGGIRPDLHNYSGWVAAGVYQRYLATGDREFTVGLLGPLIDDYEAWKRERQLPSGLYWQYDVRDAMEESISGGRHVRNVRPTLNSYQYGNACALAQIARLAEKPDLEKKFAGEAAELRRKLEHYLWNPSAQFFEVREQDGSWSNVREELGYIPWYFELPEWGHGYEAAWSQFTDPEGFRAPYGLTTAERRSPRFRTHGTGNCEWDGAVWPFATSQTLTGLANVLDDAPPAVRARLPVSARDYFEALMTYVRSQHSGGIPYLGEYLDEKTGYWLKGHNERSRWYNHSTFADLIITGVAGLRPQEGDKIVLRPLLPAGTWDWLALDHVPYHGHELTLIWDRTGAHYGRGAGWNVWQDGRRQSVDVR